MRTVTACQTSNNRGGHMPRVSCSPHTLGVRRDVSGRCRRCLSNAKPIVNLQGFGRWLPRISVQPASFGWRHCSTTDPGVLTRPALQVLRLNNDLPLFSGIRAARPSQDSWSFAQGCLSFKASTFSLVEIGAEPANRRPYPGILGCSTLSIAVRLSSSSPKSQDSRILMGNDELQ
jgi:hypothetical protein